MSTFRTVNLVKGNTKIAAIIAVVESLIWFLMVREALNFEATSFLETINIALAYASGYSVGNIVGGELSKHISGTINVQVVTSKRDLDLIKKIQDAGFTITVMNGEPSQFSCEKFIIFAVIANNRLKEFKSLIYKYDEKAFIMASETKIIHHAVIK